MKFHSNKVMAVVLAGTMALTPMTAFAATVDSPAAGITKDWTVASSAQYDANQAFSFTLTYVGATNGNYSGSQSVTNLDGSSLGAGTVVSSNLTISDLAAKAGVVNTYEGTLSQQALFSGLDFRTPGVYHFTVSENDNSNANIVKDNSTYDVYVNVAWANGSTSTTTINSVEFQKQGSTDKSNSAQFNNGAKGNGELQVYKHVAGTAANTNDEFTFTVVLNNVTGSYTVNKGDGTIEVVSFQNNVPYTFTLKDGQELDIENLPEGTTYSVQETNSQNYDSTDVSTTDKSDISGHFEKGQTPTGDGSIAAGDEDEVSFTNNKGFAPQTGITSNTLPFVAVGAVAVAGGVTLVIRRRNRAGEDF